MDLLIVAIAAYLIGSIPFGLILTRLAGYGDIRSIGSGNIGATNVLRTGNKKLALATLLLDFGKGFLPVVLFTSITLSSLDCAYLSGSENFAQLPSKCLSDEEIKHWSLLLTMLHLITLFTVLGHMFPIWLKFKGGKGVACIFGLTYALSWQAGLCISAGWLLLFFAARTSSLGALIGIPLGIITAMLLGVLAHWPALMLPIVLMILKHHENIRRLVKGEEHKFSFKKDKAL